jgi:hypothetical protein
MQTPSPRSWIVAIVMGLLLMAIVGLAVATRLDHDAGPGASHVSAQVVFIQRQPAANRSRIDAGAYTAASGRAPWSKISMGLAA